MSSGNAIKVRREGGTASGCWGGSERQQSGEPQSFHSAGHLLKAQQGPGGISLAVCRKSYRWPEKGEEAEEEGGREELWQPDSRAARGVADEMEMENLSVYHGPIGKAEGERRLSQDGRDGSYLLRNSDSVPGVYCLCVL